MYLPFREMPDDARIWIYQADREITSSEQETITLRCEKFLNEWAAHGAGLKSSFNISYDHFVVIAVDEAFHQASGCSIDATVKLIQGLGQDLNIKFFERSKVAFLIEDEIQLIPLVNFQQNLVTEGISHETMMFNNLVATKHSMEKNWLKPVGESWLSKYLEPSTT